MRGYYQFGLPLVVPTLSKTGAGMRLERIRIDRNNAESDVHDEKWLQKMIHRYPETLPIDELEPSFQPVVPVCMELPTVRGFIDKFYVTPRGNLIFAECKLWRNAEARRTVVAQALDYIESVSRWTYEDLEDAARKANASGDVGKPTKLYDLIEKVPDSLDESVFNDAVSRNLRLGRGLFLIVGDGIRESAETLTDYVGALPGLHFRLALVEIAGFRSPNDGGYLLQPRTIARTVNVERAIVRIDGGTVSVSGPVEPPGVAAGNSSRNLSEDEFFECLAEKCGANLVGRLRAFLPKLKFREVEIDFGAACLVPRRRLADDFKIALCQFETDGSFLTINILTEDIQRRGLSGLVENYLEDVAGIIGGKVVRSPKGWPSVKLNGKSPRIADLLDHEIEWLSVIGKLKESWGDRA